MTLGNGESIDVLSGEWFINDIISALRFISSPIEMSVRGFSIDSRTIESGQCFVALKGPHFDGHDFVDEALKNGASLCIVEKIVPALKDRSHLLVENTQKALEILAEYARTYTAATIIGISGSVGKTTVRNWITTLLSELSGINDVVSTTKNYNGIIGLPLSMLALRKDSRFGVFEIGIDKKGAMQGLAGLCRPHVAVLMPIAPVHIESFESIGDLAFEKSMLCSGLCAGGILVVDYESFEKYPQIRANAQKYNTSEVITVGYTPAATAFIISASKLPENMTKVVTKIAGVNVSYTIQATGRHMVFNSVMSLVAAIASSYNEKLAVIMEKEWGHVGDTLLKSMEKLEPLPGRGETFLVQWEDDRNFTLIDSSYNANPASVMAEIENLVAGYKERRKIVVIGDMMELGSISADEHLRIFQGISDSGIDKVYAVGLLVREGFDCLPSSKKGGIARNQADMLPMLDDEIRDGDVILLKGSNSMMLGELAQKLLFSKGKACFFKKTA
ncbi:MAG: UDP-N-acetylmuramoyl-tripeptide--D-alanyl-D-alanine ligase [Holosporales bacterium]|jgi:UDP-N-acetylmuramoyl-tripeptide--D-alanyl-D-alanine ligase|nr:UDP-N-acetylmuramoyl-tripeptide--D-alanyl-D-alanine ligase [Holosporales bacterium]